MAPEISGNAMRSGATHAPATRAHPLKQLPVHKLLFGEILNLAYAFETES
jgi:hypothetical protein